MEHRHPGQATGYADNFAYEPTTRRERSLAIGLAAFLTLASLLAAPFAYVRLSSEPTFLLVVESIAIVSLLLTGSTLLAQYRARRYAPIALLGIGFGVYGLGHVIYVVLFPGLFSKSGIFGAGSQSAFWIYVLARLMFSTMIVLFTYAEWREKRGLGLRRAIVARIGYGSLATMFCLATLCVLCNRFLPLLVVDRDRFSELFVTRVQPIGIVYACAALIALAVVCGLRTRVSVWLAVTLLAQILEMIMSGSVVGSRFSLGWYLGRVDLLLSSMLFIVAMQVQLAGILQRAARASTRAHTLFSLSTAPGSALEVTAKLVSAALRELDFEWGFVTRFEEGRVTIETSVGAVPADRDPRSRIESSLLRGVTSRELFVMESTTESRDRRARWGAFASVPIFVDGRFYGSAGFASRAPRKSLFNDADRDFMYLLGILIGSAIERDRRSQRLTGLAFYDSLTGLPNRAQLLEKLAERLVQGERYGTPFAIHFLDLDFFKPINDRYGHAVGDEVLREVASRLRRSVREGDMVARLGGDEFIIVQKLDTLGGGDAEILRDRIVRSFDVPIATRVKAIVIGASVGIARYPQDGTSVDDLLVAADAAQYRVKNRRRWVDPRGKPATAPRVVPIDRRRGSGAT